MPSGFRPLSLCICTFFLIGVAPALRTEESAATAARTGSSTSLALKKRVAAEVVTLGGRTKVVHKQAYYGMVSTGNPRQEFSVVYDTGSGNLLIPGTECTDRACLNHVRFNQQNSSTAKDRSCGEYDDGNSHDDRLTITFGTGSITGKCVEDDICVGALCAPGRFVASTEESDQPFSAFAFDGVLGLGRDVLAHGPDFSLIGRLASKKLLAEPLFSVFLSDSNEENSEISFGQISEKHKASELFWAPVSRDTGYWEVQIDDIALDNKPLSLCEHCYVAVDTGTSELAGPSEKISALREKLGVKSDCSNFHELPKLGFVIGTNVMNLEPNDYVDNRGGASCTVSLMDLDVPPPKGPLFILGIPFLQKFYTVYDHANEKVGFAVAKHTAGQPMLIETVDIPHNDHARKLVAPHSSLKGVLD